MSKSPLKKDGYILFHRKLWDNPVVMKDPEYLLVWLYILSSAEWEEGAQVEFRGKQIELKPGQFTIGVKHQMYNDLKEYGYKSSTKKLFFILKKFEMATQIATQKSNKCTLITVLNWEQYQKKVTQNDTQRKLKGNSKETQRLPNELNKINTNNIKKENISVPDSDEEDDEPYLMFDEVEAWEKENGRKWEGAVQY